MRIVGKLKMSVPFVQKQIFKGAMNRLFSLARKKCQISSMYLSFDQW